MADASSNSSRRWLSRSVHALLVAVLLIMVGIRVHGYFTSWATETARQTAPVAEQGVEQLHITANQAFQQGDWAHAAEVFRQIADQDPDNRRVRIRLAYALLASRQLDPALAEFLFICRFDGDVRRWALYHIACIYALKNDRQMALDYLGEAAHEGLLLRTPITDDPDFAGLMDNPEFKRLAELLKPASQRDAYHRFDFLIGEWHLVGDHHERVGSMSVTKASDGLALHGAWTDVSRSSRMTFFAYYDPSTAVWNHFWLDAEGGVLEVEGAGSGEEALVLSGEYVTATQRSRAQVTYTQDDQGLMRIEVATSSDEGASWLTLLGGTLVPDQFSEKQPREEAD